MKEFLSSKLFITLRKVGRIFGINKFIRPFFDKNGYQIKFDKIMLNSLQKHDVFWDIGSNYGQIVKQAKSLLGNNVFCIAFEPHPVLSASLKKLDFENYKVIDAAFSDIVGTSGFVYGSDPHQTTGMLNFKLSNSQKNQVKVIDVQYALKVLNLKNPNIIKIDVEGHEYEVLNSILRNVNELINLRVIFVEIHMAILDARNLTSEMNKLISRFKKETNFKLNWIDVSHFKLER